MSEYNIDPNFSVYKLVTRKEREGTVISHRQTMSAISYMIEEATRLDHAQNIIFSAFQYMSKFPPQIKRYRQIAQHAKHVYVFGVMDAEMPEIPNLTYIPLEPDFQLTKEWFIVSHGEHFSTALATEELSDFHDPDAERRFRGVWLVNDPLVTIMYDWLGRTVGERIEVSTEMAKESDRYNELTNNLKSRFGTYIDHPEKQQRVKQELAAFSAVTA